MSYGNFIPTQQRGMILSSSSTAHPQPPPTFLPSASSSTAHQLPAKKSPTFPPQGKMRQLIESPTHRRRMGHRWKARLDRTGRRIWLSDTGYYGGTDGPTGIYKKTYMTLDDWDQSQWMKTVGESFLRNRTLAPLTENPANVTGFVKNVLLRQVQKQQLVKMKSPDAVCPPSSTLKKAQIIIEQQHLMKGLATIQDLIKANKILKESDIPIIYPQKICDDGSSQLIKLNLTSTDKAFLSSVNVELRALGKVQLQQITKEEVITALQKPKKPKKKPQKLISEMEKLQIFHQKHRFYREALGWGTFLLAYKYFADTPPFKKRGILTHALYAFGISTVAKYGYDVYAKK